MKNKKPTNPTKSKLSIFRQICNLIPTHLASKLTRETNAEEKTRTFTPWSHVVSLLFAQFTHSIGLNDVCDGLKLNSGLPDEDASPAPARGKLLRESSSPRKFRPDLRAPPETHPKSMKTKLDPISS